MGFDYETGDVNLPKKRPGLIQIVGVYQSCYFKYYMCYVQCLLYCSICVEYIKVHVYTIA
jgi:hypothetical protein